MAKTPSLLDLPLEIIAKITSHMQKATLLSFSQTCRRHNQIARASLFRRLSFYSGTPKKAHQAVQKLRNDTWKHVKVFYILLYFDYDDYEWTSAVEAREDCGRRKPTDVWRDLILKLSNLTSLQVNLCFRGHADDMLKSAFWCDIFAILRLPAIQACGKAPALELYADGLRNVPSCSPVWLKLWQAFSGYRHLSIDVAEWLETPIVPDDPFMLGAAGLLASGALKSLYLRAMDEDQFKIVSKVPSVTRLDVGYDTLSSSLAAWSCIRELAPGLVHLKIDYADNTPERPSQPAFTMPHLKVLELPNENPFPQLEAQLKLMELPALQIVRMEQMIGSDPYMRLGTADHDEQAEFQREIDNLKSIIRFDASLPSGCEKREYTLHLWSEWCFLSPYAQELSRLRSAKHLNLNLTVADDFLSSITTSASQTGQPTATTYDSQIVQLSILLEPFRDLVTSLELDLDQKSASYLTAPMPVKFTRLESLELSYYDTAIQWKDLRAFLSNLILPVLAKLCIPSDENAFAQQCLTLQDWLPTWPMLQKLALTRPSPDFGMDGSQELQSLQEACKNRSPPVSFTYQH